MLGGVEWRRVREGLKAGREAAKLNQVALANAIGVNKSTVNRIENVAGEPDHVPDLDTIDRWVRATGLTLSAFFARIEGVPVAAPAFAALRREFYGDLARILLQAAKAESGVPIRDASRVPGPHGPAESLDNPDGRDRAREAVPHGQAAAVSSGATMQRLRTDLERATRDVERTRATDAARTARQSPAAARGRTAGGARGPRKPRR